MARFSDAFGITRGPQDDWFDPTLETDTQLFVDPFLIADESNDYWRQPYSRLVTFFNLAISLVTEARGRRNSRPWRMAQNLLSFPEPAEFALGYGRNTIYGAGTGRILGQFMIEAANDALAAGIRHIDNFEELLLLGNAVGPDRISDLTCNILKSAFINYTVDICKRHNLPIQEMPVKHIDWRVEEARWIDGYPVLPRNPNYPGTAVLLVPSRFLRELPTVDPGAFWDWAWLTYEDDLRDRFNYQIARDVSRREIVRLAEFRNRALWLEYLRSLRPRPYDISADIHNRIVPYDISTQLAEFIQVVPPATADDFCDWVARLLTDFIWTMEEKAGWELLWNGDVPRSERTCQIALEQTVLLACRQADVDLTREGHTGRGPVDFKLSVGWERRAQVEVKLASSGSLQRNVRFQLPQYLQSEGIECGYLLVFQFTAKECEEDSVNWIVEECRRISRETGRRYEPLFVDARRDNKPSASTIRR